MNNVVCISKSKEKEFLSLIKQDDDTFCVVINGKNICTLSEYLKIMSEEFSFPRPTSKNVDVYLDWMEDLSWIKQEKIVLFIEDFSCFLKDAPCEKIEIIELFKNNILLWWDEEVEYHVVEGKRRSFMVYLVD